VDRISLADDVAESTPQMLEYAARTHQDGSPRLAKDFLPARIEHAAMPIRVEKWQANGKLKYRVVGLLWGGSESIQALATRFNPEEEYVPADLLPSQKNRGLRGLMWSPATPGT
jgi:hypothetical protein